VNAAIELIVTIRPPARVRCGATAPARSGKRGRPRTKGDRIGAPYEAAATCAWKKVSVARYGRIDTVGIVSGRVVHGGRLGSSVR
jgi:hypothetical protein